MLNNWLYIFLNLFILCIYLFLAVLGLHCCARAFSSCSEHGLLFVAVHRLLIAVASLLQSTGSRCAGSCGSQAQQLWRTGLVAPWHVGSSQTRARTRVPCIGRRILNYCATREALGYIQMFMDYIKIHLKYSQGKFIKIISFS